MLRDTVNGNGYRNSYYAIDLPHAVDLSYGFLFVKTIEKVIRLCTVLNFFFEW